MSELAKFLLVLAVIAILELGIWILCCVVLRRMRREKWLRGEDEESCLLRKRDGKMCCLGFFALACGMTEADILGRTSPLALGFDDSRFPEWLTATDAVTQVSRVYSFTEPNDDLLMVEEDRERVIAAEFAKHGVTVEFVGGAAPAAPKEPQP